MIKPERRTKGDLWAAAAIAIVVAVVAAVVWWTSDARATISRPATSPSPPITSARAVPATLQERWTAPSPHTDQPLVVAGNVVTGEGREISGRDPISGEQRWSFSRDRDLCGVTWVYDLAVAVYRDVRGCGQVSTVDARTGQRKATRSGYMDKKVTLNSDGTTVLAAGSTRVEMWRSDMVRTLAFGDIDAPLNPPLPPEPPCQFLSAAASSAAVSILEVCPDAPDVSLMMLKVSDEDVAPEQRYNQNPGVSADSGARVLAMSDLRTAVYLPTPQPRVAVYDENGQELASTLLAKPAVSDATVSRAGNYVTYWTGDSVYVFDATSLTYRYTISGGTKVPEGPGAMMADRLLIPLTGAIGVYDPATGSFERTIAVDRGDAIGPITLGVTGTTVVEQRGDTVVGLVAPA